MPRPPLFDVCSLRCNGTCHVTHEVEPAALKPAAPPFAVAHSRSHPAPAAGVRDLRALRVASSPPPLTSARKSTEIGQGRPRATSAASAATADLCRAAKQHARTASKTRGHYEDDAERPAGTAESRAYACKQACRPSARMAQQDSTFHHPAASRPSGPCLPTCPVAHVVHRAHAFPTTAHAHESIVIHARRKKSMKSGKTARTARSCSRRVPPRKLTAAAGMCARTSATLQDAVRQRPAGLSGGR